MFDPAMIVWIDETGCDRSNALHHNELSIWDMAPQDHQLQLRGVLYSAIGILSMDCVMDMYITEDTVNVDICLDFLCTNLLPLLMQFDGINHNSIGVMDNASVMFHSPHGCCCECHYLWCWSLGKNLTTVFTRPKPNRVCFCGSQTVSHSK